MISKYLRMFSIASVLLTIAACGTATRTQQTGVTNPTQLVLMAEKLTGSIISLNERRFTVGKNDLEKYRFGVLGAADSEKESLEIIRLDVAPGNIALKVYLNGRELANRNLYLVEGQTREIKL
jgi:hypothetical protein